MRDELIAQLRQLSENTGARLLALTEVDYADPQDQFAAQVIRKIGQGEVITNVVGTTRTCHGLFRIC